METVLELISLIYDSVADASRWPVFLKALAGATRADTVSLSIGDPRWDEYGFACQYGMSEEDGRRYIALIGEGDPWIEAAVRLPEGAVAPSHELWDVEEMVKTPMYREFMAPRGWFYGLGGIIWVTDISRSVISLVRQKTLGPCLECDLSTVRQLMPHLRRAAQLHGELISLRSQRSAFTDHLDRYPQAFVLTDANARIIFANTAAIQITSLHDGLKTEAVRFMAQSPRENAALHKAIGEVAAAPDSPRRLLAITRSSSAPPYRLVLMPVQGSRAVPLGLSQPAVAVLIIDSESKSSPNVGVLKELFSLTAGEARVIAKLVQGQNVDEVAAELNISVETVRTHIRRALCKTATNRQGELIALVLRTVPPDAL